MRSSSLLRAAAITLALCSLGQAPATAPATAPTAGSTLLLDMEGGKSLTLSDAEVAALPHEQVKATEHSGTVATYSGVPLDKLLEKIDAPFGEKNLRGKNMALYVVAEGADGYKTTFSLTEIDPGFSDRHILVADLREGQPLAAKWGPLQLIVPTDKRQGRWVRMLTALHIRRAQ
jgi:DMSO/TMAO reductase YedYZ molybdopterin-dependent catalytic subunit